MKLRLLTAISIGLLSAQAYAAEPVHTSTTQTTTTTTTVKQQATPAKASEATLTTEMQKISYSIGFDLGQNFKSQKINIDAAMLEHGFKDAQNGTTPALTTEQMASTLLNFQKELMAKRQTEFAAASKKNEDEGTQFLAANKTKPGVITTPSGLEYKILEAGKGTNPTGSDIVTVDYAGSFIDGKVFDSSYQHGKPVTFQVAEVIPGWTEVLKLMKPGSTYEVFVPYNLAYGERGLGNVIGPKQTLIFKIHLISVKPESTQHSANATH